MSKFNLLKRFKAKISLNRVCGKTPHTPHPTPYIPLPTPQKKELGEKNLILRQGFCKATGQHFGILLKCSYHEVDFTTDRV
ncbi:hypothetical protein [Microcystis sp. LSC13-02]|jgi:hypothetical protein|uniref:hypothetical protein n=1 Tax=Microcystis sp. LSC13-02 TaxID=1895004 RepID=UPI002579670F|nr:hypothetical protein [Microcystis sp. LSC13-02]